MGNVPGSYDNKLGFTVGVEDWLDSSEAKRYWRAIEYGSSKWSNQIVAGLWGPSAGTNDRPNTLRPGEFDAAGGGTERRDQKFVPFFRSKGGANRLKAARAALIYYFGAVPVTGPRGGESLIPTEHLDKLKGDTLVEKRRVFYYLITRAPVDRIPFVRVRITKPILAHDYYGKALEKFDLVEEERAALTEAFKAWLGKYDRSGNRSTVDPGKQAGTNFLRQANADERGQVADSNIRGRNGNDYRKYGVISLGVSVRTTSLIHGNSSFSVFQSEITKSNRLIAERFQAEVVQMMRKGHRPATGDLIRATESPNNRFPR